MTIHILATFLCYITNTGSPSHLPRLLVSEPIIRWELVYQILLITRLDRACRNSWLAPLGAEIDGGAFAPNEYGSVVLYAFPRNTQKRMVSILGFFPNRKSNQFVIRLCASEVDRKPIHSDEHHEWRWLLWYLLSLQISATQSAFTSCMPPSAAKARNSNDLLIRESSFGAETARAKPGEH